MLPSQDSGSTHRCLAGDAQTHTILSTMHKCNPVSVGCHVSNDAQPCCGLLSLNVYPILLAASRSRCSFSRRPSCYLVLCLHRLLALLYPLSALHVALLYPLSALQVALLYPLSALHVVTYGNTNNCEAIEHIPEAISIVYIASCFAISALQVALLSSVLFLPNLEVFSPRLCRAAL